jgi:hypothetical protein
VAGRHTVKEFFFFQNNRSGLLKVTRDWRHGSVSRPREGLPVPTCVRPFFSFPHPRFPVPIRAVSILPEPSPFILSLSAQARAAQPLSSTLSSAAGRSIFAVRRSSASRVPFALRPGAISSTRRSSTKRRRPSFEIHRVQRLRPQSRPVEHSRRLPPRRRTPPPPPTR